MRILMLAQFYPPVIGGEERHVQDLSRALVKRGHEVAVATLWQSGMSSYEEDQGVRIYRLRGSFQRLAPLYSGERRFAPPFPDPEVMLALRRVIARERPTIVHAHNWLLYSFVPLKTWSKAKLVMTLHDCSIGCVQKRFMYHNSLCSGPGAVRCLECATAFYGPVKGVPTALAHRVCGSSAYRAVDMFLPVSTSMIEANQLRRYTVPFQVVPNFVPTTQEKPGHDLEPYLAQLPTNDFLLFVGDISRDKGVEVLLQAYAGLPCPPPLVLIGRRPDALFPTNLPKGVLMLHDWPHDAVMAAWQRCTVALVPSLCLESFGIVALEAMSMGRPVIASCIGGLSDIVEDGKTGFLVPPGDWRLLRQAMQHLLADPMLRAQIGEAGRCSVAQFQAEAVVPRIEQVYSEVLQA